MRLLIKLFVTVIVLVIATLIAIPFFVNPNDYKQEIADQVEQATGRTLTLEGDIELSVFPWIALELGPLSLSNAKGFNADSFAAVKAAEIRIKLLPLLKKQLEMDTIVLDGLELNLETNKAGKTNWDDLAGAPSAESTEKPVSPKNTNSSAAPLAAITIAGVQLTDANVNWIDAKQGQTFKLKNLNLTTDPLVPGEPTALDMTFDIESTAPQAELNIGLSTQLVVDVDNQQYALTDLSFSTKANGKELPFETVDLTLKADVNADMAKQLIAVNGLDLDTNLTGSTLPGGKADIKLNTDIKVDLSKQTASLSSVVIEAVDLLIKGEVNATNIQSEQPQFSGTLNIDAFNLRQLAKQLSIELPETSDNSTLSLIALDTEFAGTTNSFTANSLNVSLDQSKLTGNLGVTNFSKPVINFKLNLDEIDADRYLPPVAENEQPKAAPPATAAAAGATELPLEPLRQLNVKGSLDIGKLKISGITSEKIHVTLKAADGLVKLSPMSANLYDGQYNGNVTLDARSNALKLAIDEKITGVQAGPLLNDLSGDAPISGTATASAKLTGAGSNVDQIKATLTGSGNFAFTDGALKGINIGESIRKAKAALKGESLPQSNEPVETDFASLSGSFKATNGLISNQDLALMSPLLRVSGAGNANLPTEAIDYALKVSIVETSKGQGGKDLADLKGLTIPVKISGTFQSPKPSVDLASLFEQKAKDEAKQKIKEKLDEKLGDKLGGLLGGSSKDGEATESGSSDKVDPKELLKGFF
jgi:AsmA protein